MGHRDYSDGFTSPGPQRNIMAFVGNGFDVQVMRDYASPVDTRYVSFYHFLKLRSFDPENPILKEMEFLQESGDEDWSDIEGVVDNLLRANRIRATDLITALREMQGEFSEFLSLAVPSSLLTRLGTDSMDNGRAVKSLATFLQDLDPVSYRDLEFAKSINNFDIFNFVFINFNYTSLLDDFVYLDQKQFDPLPRKTVDRNFDFEGNPAEVPGAAVRPGDVFSSYVMTEVVHPHGHQSIPRSLLFGVDEPAGHRGNQDPSLRLAKPFWAQNERRFKHLLDDTELFIIFGCSIGESDRWWWRNIADSLGAKRARQGRGDDYHPEVIIYWFNGGIKKMSTDDVRAKFFRAAGVAPTGKAEDFVHVVLYDATSERIWLNTQTAT